MLKFIILSIFSFVVLLCNAQHLLVFENMKNGKITAYKLPVQAMCKFKNKENISVIIDSIQGDSFYCRLRNANSVQCFSLSSIKKIDNYNSEMNKLTLNLGLVTIGTAIMISGTYYGFYYQEYLSTDPGDNLFGSLALIASPITAAFALTEIYLGVKYLFTVSFEKWKFYGIQVH